jgi:uroporphyrinogen-III synthase
MTRPGVLLTRPREDSEDLARDVERLGYHPVIEPMLTIEPVAFVPPDLPVYSGLIFTSAQAPRFFPASSRLDIPVYTVGDQTAAAARAAGYCDVRSASGDVEDLEQMITGIPGTFLYVRGEDVSRPLHRAVDQVTVYRAVKSPEMSPQCLSLLKNGEISHALFFSRRSAKTFVDLIHQNKLEGAVSGINALCIGAGMVELLSVLPWRRIDVASAQNRAAMLDLLAR